MPKKLSDPYNNEEMKKKARLMYEGVNSYNDYASIARHLNVPYNTIKEFAAIDRENGDPWVKPAMTKMETACAIMPDLAENFSTDVTEPITRMDIVDSIAMNNYLDEKQKQFCLFYLKSFNGPQAAKEAGFSNYASASINLLNNKHVREALSEISQAMCNKLYITAEKVIERHLQIAFSDIKDFIDLENTTSPIYDTDGNIIGERRYQNIRAKDLREVDGSLIKKLSKNAKTGEIELELEDRSKSLDTLTKLLTLTKAQERQEQLYRERLEIEKKRLAVEDSTDIQAMAKLLKNLGEEDLKELISGLE